MRAGWLISKLRPRPCSNFIWGYNPFLKVVLLKVYASGDVQVEWSTFMRHDGMLSALLLPFAIRLQYSSTAVLLILILPVMPECITPALCW
jgi:hypothetical protein